MSVQDPEARVMWSVIGIGAGLSILLWAIGLNPEVSKPSPPKIVMVEGKVAPTTRLPEADTKKECSECHKK